MAQIKKNKKAIKMTEKQLDEMSKRALDYDHIKKEIKWLAKN